jgi:hypothetical protein
MQSAEQVARCAYDYALSGVNSRSGADGVVHLTGLTQAPSWLSSLRRFPLGDQKGTRCGRRRLKPRLPPQL